MSTVAETEVKESLVVYDVMLPSKKLLFLGMGLGIVLAMSGTMMFLAPLYQYQLTLAWGDAQAPSPALPMMYGAICLIVGSFVYIRSSFQHDVSYKIVEQGLIIKRDTFGGSHWPFAREMLIEGNTKANQIRQVWVKVSPRAWRAHQVGDFIDFR